LSHDAEEILNPILAQKSSMSGCRNVASLNSLGSKPLKNREVDGGNANLYTLVVTLNDDRKRGGSGQLSGRIPQSRDRNGSFLSTANRRLRGVNGTRSIRIRQRSHARNGADITLMKQANINAVRTCHYPDDRAGTSYATLRLYVLDEANICTHGTRGCWRMIALGPARFWTRATHAERDKNHRASSSGRWANESGYGPNFAAVSGWLMNSTRRGRCIMKARRADEQSATWTSLGGFIPG